MYASFDRVRTGMNSPYHQQQQIHTIFRKRCLPPHWPNQFVRIRAPRHSILLHPPFYRPSMTTKSFRPTLTPASLKPTKSSTKAIPKPIRTLPNHRNCHNKEPPKQSSTPTSRLSDPSQPPQWNKQKISYISGRNIHQ